MDSSGFPLEQDELKGFLQGLSQVTALSMSYFPPESESPAMVIGEPAFCLLVKAGPSGSGMCPNFSQDLRARAGSTGRPEFDLCPGRLGEMAVPLVDPGGKDLGTVMMTGFLIQGLTEEHKAHLRELGKEWKIDDPDQLVMAAREVAVFTRSRIEALGFFVQRQLLEKASTRDTIEDTTEYLLQKYEELMFFYAITESILPDSGHARSLDVMLDKAIQKVGAAWGLFLLREPADEENFEFIEAGRSASGMMKADGLPAEVSRQVLSCSGPALIPGGNSPGSVRENLLVVPFRISRQREGYLVLGCRDRGSGGEAAIRFSLALSRQAASVLYAVQLYRDLVDLLFATLGAFSSAIDAKDPYTHGHSRRVAEYAVRTARHMGQNPKSLTMLKIAGQLHDFGKIGITETILRKQSRLDFREEEAMKEHPAIGAQILSRFKAFEGIVPGIRHHHERFDGSGYPDGKKGDEIPLVGRIIAVADAYDAMTTSRPYKRGLGHREAVAELRRSSGLHFDPDIVEAFIEAFEGTSHD